VREERELGSGLDGLTDEEHDVMLKAMFVSTSMPMPMPMRSSAQGVVVCAVVWPGQV
jgi:hypothetical protein